MMNYFVISSNPMDGKVFDHLFKYNPNIHYNGQAFSDDSGLATIEETKPELVFLEIKPEANAFHVDIVKLIKEVHTSNYLICFSLFDQYNLFQSAIDFGAYSFLPAPIDRKRIIRIVEKIKVNIDQKESTHINPSHTIPYEKIFAECLNASSTELEKHFNEMWHHYFIKENDHFPKIISKCQKLSTEFYYYLINIYNKDINETLIILYNNFMLEITKIKTKTELKHLLYSFIKDCNCTINKDTHDLSRDRIIQVKKLINQYINEEKSISLESIAKEMFISPSYLSRTFRKIEGIKYIDYVNLYRLDKAKFLLSTTTNTIENIAYICGYNEPNSFRRLFKQKLGITPNAFRNTQKEK